MRPESPSLNRCSTQTLQSEVKFSDTCRSPNYAIDSHKIKVNNNFIAKRSPDSRVINRLLKFEKLRLHITLAKIRHVQSDKESALSYWKEAMEEIGKFQLTNGRTTRIIVISICDALKGLGQTSLLDEYMKQLESLDKMMKPGGTQYWIAGMWHWSEYLECRSSRS